MGWFHSATGSASVLATRAARSRKNRRMHAFTNFACILVEGLRLAASTTWFTNVNSS